MPVEVIIGAISAIKGEFGPSLNGEGFKDVFIMELPNTQGPEALKLWKKEIIRFKEYLE